MYEAIREAINALPEAVSPGVGASLRDAALPELDKLETAFNALNELRSNMVATQSASWSNLSYPLVAILNAAGFEQFDSTPDQMRQHMYCYGGAGGYPGHIISEPIRGWCAPVGELARMRRAAQRYLEAPTPENKTALTLAIGDNHA